MYVYFILSTMSVHTLVQLQRTDLGTRDCRACRLAIELEILGTIRIVVLETF